MSICPASCSRKEGEKKHKTKTQLKQLNTDFFPKIKALFFSKDLFCRGSRLVAADGIMGQFSLSQWKSQGNCWVHGQTVLPWVASDEPGNLSVTPSCPLKPAVGLHRTYILRIIGTVEMPFFAVEKSLFLINFWVFFVISFVLKLSTPAFLISLGSSYDVLLT